MGTRNSKRGIFLNAAFLMSISAIGPGFLTQTTVFTNKLLASFGFVILISILLDIAAQVNIWRIISVHGKRAQDIANETLPGSGYTLAALILIGGLAFNIGNVAGAGLGLNVIFGLDTKWGAAGSAIIGISIFLSREAGRAMDAFMKFLGIIMIVLALYVAITSHPPVLEALKRTFFPITTNLGAIITLVGGTVGGYISFAGAHRLMDAGIKGKESIPRVNSGAVTGIGITSFMRVILFLASLGVISHGAFVDPSNPPASIFRTAAGMVGYRIFGIVLWVASITSVVGSAYTSVSFISSLSKAIEKNTRLTIIIFIVLSTAIFITLGQPVRLLIFAGALNGLILPLALGILLVAANLRSARLAYRHPWVLTASGAMVVIAMLWMGVKALSSDFSNLF